MSVYLHVIVRAALSIAVFAGVDPAFGATSNGSAATPRSATLSKPRMIDPERGGVMAVSCPTTTFCAAVDVSGGIVLFNGKTWSDAGMNHDAAWTRVYCRTASLCFATDVYGRLSTYRGTSWSRPAATFGTRMTAMTCPSNTSCRAFDSRGGEWLWNGASWTVTGQQVQPMAAVWCSSTASCKALATNGDGYTLTAGQWTPSRGIGASRSMGAASCAADGTCVAATDDDSERVFQFTDRWRRVPRPGFAVVTISCAARTFCFAIGDTHKAAIFDGTDWHRVTWPDLRKPGFGESGISVVSCATRSSCVLVNSGNSYRYNGKVVQRLPEADHSRGSLRAISCPTKAWCMATDEYQNWLIRKSGGHWSAPKLGVGISALSCTSSRFCVSFFRYRGQRWDGHGWRKLPTVPGHLPIEHVSCSGPHYCLGIGDSGYAAVLKDNVWGKQTTLRARLESVACWSHGNCIAGTRNGYVRMRAGKWLEPKRVQLDKHYYGFATIACPRPANCFGGDKDAVLHLRHGSVTVTRHVMRGQSLSLSCSSATRCVDIGVTNRSGIGYRYWVANLDGAKWASAQRAPATATAVSCQTAQRCIAVGGATAFTVTLP